MLEVTSSEGLFRVIFFALESVEIISLEVVLAFEGIKPPPPLQFIIMLLKKKEERRKVNVKQVIEEETERSPFYSRGQLFTFHISFAHNLFSLYISYLIYLHPVFTLHFAIHSHVCDLYTTCFHFTFHI